VLNPSAPLSGFDTGPGNTLLDSWHRAHQQGEAFDRDGAWAASGKVLPALLSKMLADPYFARPAPKSTGREYFNVGWLRSQLGSASATSEDIQATLVELTAVTIANSIRTCMVQGQIWLCGGGAHNAYMTQRIRHHLRGFKVASTEALGIAPEWVEAVAFAWLARARLRGEAAGIPSVTGARSAGVLGSLHLPPES
jgi:anhydro-N-acetylmuramic acid kinase